MLNNVIKLVVVLGLLVSTVVSAADYTLGAGDTIRISVYGEEDLSVNGVLIDSGESLEYPYLGTIVIKNKTLRDLQEMITSGLRNGYLIDPKVTVNMVKYRNIYVNGVVNKPGGYEYQPDLTVEKAISLAGGFLAKYRKTKGIYLTKQSEVKGLNQDQIQDLLKNKKTADLSAPVNPGDTIYVVSSFW
jgi:polysaccharide biosynthesis/export protein VpsN